MLRFSYSLVLTSVLALSACGGSGGGLPPDANLAAETSVSTNPTPAAAETPATPESGATTGNTTADTTGGAQPTAKTQVIDYYGDSTIWGYASGSGARVAKPAPTVFAESLAASSAQQFEVHNEGVNRSTACDLLNGTDGKHPDWETQMSASNADVVIFNHGINDEWKYDLGTYKSCLTSLSQTAKKHGKRVIFETPNPTLNSGSNAQDVWVEAMRQVAAQEQAPLIDQYRYLTDYLAGKSPYTICPDGLHPTDAVYAMKGKYAAGEYRKLLAP